MTAPRTYRSRLVFYIGVLLLFLVTSQVLSYHSSRNMVLKEAENNAARIAQQIEGHIEIEIRDLAERARMVRDNSEFTSYMYVAISLGTDPGAVRELYTRQFGWLQIDRALVLSRTGKAFIGAEHSDLRSAIVIPGVDTSSGESQFYLKSTKGLEMVAVAPLLYRSQSLGAIAVTKTLDEKWMNVTRQMSGGHLALVHDGRIVLNTISPDWNGQAFTHTNDHAQFDAESYLVRRVHTGDDPKLPQMWFAMSQQTLNAKLQEQLDRMVTLVLLGCAGGLLVGFMMLKNFSAPLGRLVTAMQQVGEGRFPEIRRGPARDEIGYLTNRFSEMVASLREQQEEVQRAHAQLEREATTDALTGLYNRRYLYDIFPKLWSEALRQGKNLSLIIVDLDNFKKVNDRYGHPVGDLVLLHFAKVLRDNSRVSDFLFRLGGEEFLVLSGSDTEGGMHLAEKIRIALEREVYRDAERSIPVTASFGVAQADGGDGVNGLNQTLKRADNALYTAKQGGRNRVAVWYPQRESA